MDAEQRDRYSRMIDYATKLHKMEVITREQMFALNLSDFNYIKKLFIETVIGIKCYITDKDGNFTNMVS